MATRSRLSVTNNGDDTHTIDHWVAYDTGGGPPGTVDVNVTIKWTTSDLTNPESASPSNPTPFVSAAGGYVLWQDATVDESGTTFSIKLTCNSSGTTTVQGIVEEVIAPRSRILEVYPGCS